MSANRTQLRQLHRPAHGVGSRGGPRLALQDANQILQPWGDNHVVWLFEDHHVNRIITMDARPAVGENIKLWNGYSRGRWEGKTLVIEVTNLNGYTWFDDSGNFYTDAAHLVERLTMVDPDTIHYEVTIEDSKAYTRPWKLVGPSCGRRNLGLSCSKRRAGRGNATCPVFARRATDITLGKAGEGAERQADPRPCADRPSPGVRPVEL